jgi:hypothetical protein
LSVPGFRWVNKMLLEIRTRACERLRRLALFEILFDRDEDYREWYGWMTKVSLIRDKGRKRWKQRYK